MSNTGVELGLADLCIGSNGIYDRYGMFENGYSATTVYKWDEA